MVPAHTCGSWKQARQEGFMEKVAFSLSLEGKVRVFQRNMSSFEKRGRSVPR